MDADVASGLRSELEPIPTLRTSRLLLRPFAPLDAARVRLLAGAPEVASTTLKIPHPYEEGMAEAWIAGHGAAWTAREHLTLAITAGSEGLVGGVGLHLALEHRRGELGYWIGVPYWNRGYATEACVAVLAYGFDELGLHRVLARHVERNPASGRVMRKLGMTHEGRMREHVLKWDRFETLEVYGILEGEWRAADES